jgi:hypothetical protein
MWENFSPAITQSTFMGEQFGATINSGILNRPQLSKFSLKTKLQLRFMIMVNEGRLST